MSNSIPIPRRAKPTSSTPSHEDSVSSPASSSYNASSYADSSSSWSSSRHNETPSRAEGKRGKDKGRAGSAAEGTSAEGRQGMSLDGSGSVGGEGKVQRFVERRPSLLSEEIRRAEHIVVDVGGPGGMRLISCVKTSQGFDWNPEIFLPSHYADRDYGEMERHQEPVLEIIVTDEERERMGLS